MEIFRNTHNGYGTGKQKDLCRRYFAAPEKNSQISQKEPRTQSFLVQFQILIKTVHRTADREVFFNFPKELFIDKARTF